MLDLSQKWSRIAKPLNKGNLKVSLKVSIKVSKKIMAKNVNITPPEDDILDPSSLPGDPVNQLKMLSLQSVNPWSGNGKLIRNGGFQIALAQAPDPSSLFPIGPRMTNTPMKRGDKDPKPYDVFGASSFEAYLVGSTPKYNIILQDAVIDGTKPIAVGPFQWVKYRTDKGLYLTKTKTTLYFVFVGDATNKIYRMDVDGYGTDYAVNLVNSVGELAQDYQVWAKEKGKEIAIPSPFFIKLKIGVPEDPIATPLGGAITPPVLDWSDNGGKRPQSLKEVAPYRVSQEKYNELAEIAKKIKDYLASPEAPNYPGILSQEFLDAVGYTQIDGKLLPANQISAPKSAPKAAPRMKLAEAVMPANLVDLTPAQFIERGGAMDGLIDLFIGQGVEDPKVLLNTFSASKYEDLKGSIKMIAEVFLADQ